MRTSEIRRPRSEGNPKPEGRRTVGAGVPFLEDGPMDPAELEDCALTGRHFELLANQAGLA
ncbi:MAG: hypothetical protein AAB466_07235 [Verrucomicrobiota bacterium]